MNGYLLNKKLISAILAVLMLFTMLPVNVSAGTDPTDYLYGNSQGVGNKNIEISVTGGTVDLYIKIPAGTYVAGTNGQFGFDLTGIPDAFTCTQDYTTYKTALENQKESWTYEPTPWGYDADGKGELTDRDKRKAFIVVYDNSVQEPVTLSGDAVLAAMRITVPSGLTKGSTYQIGVTSQRRFYQNNTCVFDKTEGIPDEWVITIVESGSGGGGGGGGGGGNPPVTDYTLTYETNGGTKYEKETYSAGTLVSLNKVPEKEGAEFTGWYSDAALTNKITEVKMDSDKTVYAGWRYPGASGNLLNKEDHDTYMIGYQDGMFHPNSPITRAETAAMIFRLLKPEKAQNYLRGDCDFEDIVGKRWYKTYVSTLSNIGIVEGYKDNTFQPSRAITRAEFTVMMDRFFLPEEEVSEDDHLFSDISDSYWARDAIYRCVKRSLIEGYDDGTFRPYQSITRAEAAAIMNRVLSRNPASKDALLPGMVQWPDNSNTNSWYYIDVQESSNGHEYVRNADGTEQWTALKEGSDWKQYE